MPKMRYLPTLAQEELLVEGLRVRRLLYSINGVSLQSISYPCVNPMELLRTDKLGINN